MRKIHSAEKHANSNELAEQEACEVVVRQAVCPLAFLLLEERSQPGLALFWMTEQQLP